MRAERTNIILFVDLETLSYVLESERSIIFENRLLNASKIEATGGRWKDVELALHFEVFRSKLERRAEELRRVKCGVHCSFYPKHYECH